MKALKLSMALLAVSWFGFAATAQAATANSTLTGPVCEYASFLPGCGEGASQNLESNRGYLFTLTNVFLFAAAVVAVIFILVGGIKYITSGGDPARIINAKNTLQYAIIGLIVALIARGIVEFILAPGRVGG